jgi:alanine racemase
MRRPTCALVDLDALRANYRLARQMHGGHALAVIKANAYGHGAIPCAQALTSLVDGFAVAFLDEAITLRDAGVRAPVLVLEGVLTPEELRIAGVLDLWLVVHDEAQIRMLERRSAPPARLHVWLKIDTGMHRAGLDPRQAVSAHRRLMRTGRVKAITLMSHFACADDPAGALTQAQIESFDRATAQLPGPHSLCNSAGLAWWPEARRDWARPGIMLYGAVPAQQSIPGLQPVMTFSSRIIATRTLEAGESLGYGAAYTAPARKRIGLVCAGYADGYPQNAPTGTPVAVDGRRTTLVGRVSMDLITVDLTDLPGTNPGSTVELWGPLVPVNAIAEATGRLAYELLCSVKRAPLLHRSHEPVETDQDRKALTPKMDCCHRAPLLGSP